MNLITLVPETVTVKLVQPSGVQKGQGISHEVPVTEIKAVIFDLTLARTCRKLQKRENATSPM